MRPPIDTDRLVWLVQDFVQDNQITCAEAVYQTDRVAENALELIEQLCELVGYHEREDD